MVKCPDGECIQYNRSTIFKKGAGGVAGRAEFAQAIRYPTTADNGVTGGKRYPAIIVWNIFGWFGIVCGCVSGMS